MPNENKVVNFFNFRLFFNFRTFAFDHIILNIKLIWLLFFCEFISKIIMFQETL
jgi:hypothetical protein